MIVIEKIKGDSIFYACACGVRGKCIFRSFDEEGVSLINIRCPSCESFINMSIGKVPIKKQEEDIDYSLSIVLSNTILVKGLIE